MFVRLAGGPCFDTYRIRLAMACGVQKPIVVPLENKYFLVRCSFAVNEHGTPKMGRHISRQRAALQDTHP